MLIKYIVNAEWAIWKTIFCKTYGNKGRWQVKYIFTFKFQGGSLREMLQKRKIVTRDKNIDTHNNSPYCYGLIRLYNVQNGLGSNRNRLQFFLIKLVNMNEQSLV